MGLTVPWVGPGQRFSGCQTVTVVGRAMARSMVGQLLSELRQMDVDTNLKGQSCTDIFATSCSYLPLYGSYLSHTSVELSILVLVLECCSPCGMV